MITKNDDLLGTLIHDVAHLLRLDIDRRVASQNLTRVKWLALGVLHNKPGVTQAELAQELELGTAAVGRLVDRLEDRGFIVRSKNPDDRRAYLLSLTADAEVLLRSMDETANALRNDLLDGLSEREIASLNRGLAKLKENLRRAGAAALSVFPIRFEAFTDVQWALQSTTLV